MIRWHLQQGRSAIPKSVKPGRIEANFDVFDFDLTVDGLHAIDALDLGFCRDPEPDDVTTKNRNITIPDE